MEHSKSRCVASATAAFVLGLAGAGAFATPAMAAQSTIDLAVISDFHGHIENAAALDYAIDQMRAVNPETHFVSVGDNVGGSAFVSSIDQDYPTMDILKAMGLELSAAGNHEFDKGYADLVDRIQPRMGIPILAANAAGADEISNPGYVIENYGGVDVAFVGGVTTEMPTLVSVSAIEGITFSDPAEKVNEIADALKDGDEANDEADVVVALIHADIDSFTPILNENVDLAFGGHTHVQHEGVSVGGAPACEPINYGTAFVKASITVADDGTVTATCAPAAIDTAQQSGDIAAMYEEAQEKAVNLGSGEVGYIDGDANRGSRTGAGGEGSNRGTESPAGNLIADAFYAYGQSFTHAPDLGIMNPGGVRADLKFDANTDLFPTDLDGLVNLGESNTVQPFGNIYGFKDYTGAQLYTMLEQQWGEETAEHPVLRLGLSSNVRYTYDPTAPKGGHILQLFINDELVPNDDSQLYTVASNTFLLEGGDGFTVLGEGTNFLDTGMIDNDAFNDYLKQFPQDKPLHVDYTQRSFGVHYSATNVKPGDTLTADLYSLAMTSGEPVPSKVTVTLTSGNTTLEATADVDATPNASGYDESGTATVRFTIPADISAGEAALSLSADDGSAVNLPSISVVAGADPAPVPDPEQGNSGSGEGNGGAGVDKLSKTGVTLGSPIALFLVTTLTGIALLGAKRRVMR